MVKNTSGGNKAKSFARKHTQQSGNENGDNRTPVEPFELIGTVTKMLGNGMFYVKTETHPQLLGHIRHKFKARNKKDNFISAGSSVIVGLREWEDPNFKNCDLIYIYNQTIIGNDNNGTEENCAFHFSNTEDNETSIIVQSNISNMSSIEEEIHFDEI